MHTPGWVGFFEGHNQASIEARQTQFMAEKMGGDTPYSGKDMRMAHRQMYITPELFELRHQLLRQAIQEAGVPHDLARRWLQIDAAFYRHIVKGSIESFYAYTWTYETRLIVPKPR